MTGKPSVQQELQRLTLFGTGAVGAGGLATLLAPVFAVAPSVLAQRLESLPSVLSEAFPEAGARRVVTLARLAGADIRIEPASARGSGPRHDLGLVISDPAQLPRIRAWLHWCLGWSDRSVNEALEAPDGILLRSVGSDLLETLNRRMGNIRGVKLVAFTPESESYDLFACNPDPMQEVAFGAVAASLGLQPCGLTGARAAGLNHATARWLDQRVGGQGFVVIARALQRFDLVLTKLRGATPAEAADFLATRGRLPLDVLRRLPRHLPLVIETGLPRARAEEFSTDYAAIGLMIRMICANTIRPQQALTVGDRHGGGGVA